MRIHHVQSVPGGPDLLTAEKVAARYSLRSLFSREIRLPLVRVENAELLFATGADGELVGWSRFAAESDTAAAAQAEPPPWAIEPGD